MDQGAVAKTIDNALHLSSCVIDWSYLNLDTTGLLKQTCDVLQTSMMDLSIPYL